MVCTDMRWHAKRMDDEMMRGREFGYGYGMMGGGGFGLLLLIAFWLVVIAAVALLIVWAVRSSGHHGAAMGHMPSTGAVPPGAHSPTPTHDEAVAIARWRFAAGDITKEEFDEIMKSLGS